MIKMTVTAVVVAVVEVGVVEAVLVAVEGVVVVVLEGVWVVFHMGCGERGKYTPGRVGCVSR